ncbi:MAG: YeiH family putative sulfate export transporter [Verrucomicrobia bacterium]|nr:YeiH family putative sulfate export transporter [Verrucomicrobiota bacterium]
MAVTAKSTAPVRDYAWAEYLDCMEGFDRPDARAALHGKKALLAGVSLCAGIALVAMAVTQLPLWPFTLAGGRHPLEPVMLAILLGMVVGNAGVPLQPLQAGIKLVARKVLAIGIVLLGARLNFLDVLRVGMSGIVLTLVEVGLALAIMVLLTRWLGLSTRLGTLIGVGTAICGGTAIVATAPVIEADEKDVVFSVATVTLLGLVAMVVLPFVAHLLAMGEKDFGLWAGLAIHQTPQVIASGFAFGERAGETATVVKLARVCLLAPVVFFVGLWYARTRPGMAAHKIHRRNLFPVFVLGFLAMALARSLGLLPALTVQLADGSLFGAHDWRVNLPQAAQRISEYCIVASMAAVGLETKFSALRRTGLQPFFAGLIASVVIALALLMLIR